MTGVDVSLKRIYPDVYAQSVIDLKTDFFLSRGIKGLIFDLDNTMIPWRGSEFPSEVLKCFRAYQDAGLKICIVSNAFNHRVSRLLDPLKLPYVGRARKPRRRAFLEAMGIMKTNPEETAVIGDQLFTDILGGNRCGCFTVLVVPMTDRDFWATRLVRIIERALLRKVSGQYSGETR